MSEAGATDGSDAASIDLNQVLAGYLALFPEDEARLTLLREQLTAKNAVMNDRSTLPGHVTGAAIVLSPDRTKVLLIHHRFLDMWLQPGGHWDPDENTPLQAARREAEEETGVSIAEYLPASKTDPLVPVHIETHQIPANAAKQEPGHYHHDFRYVFVAGSKVLSHQETEVSQAAWFDFDAPEAAAVAEPLERFNCLAYPAGQ